MRIMAIDYGKKRTGVAITDPLGIIAQPLLTIAHRSQKELIVRLKFIIEENNIGLILVGNPISHTGQNTEISQEIIKFANKLEARFQLPVKLWDERFTSQYALKSMKDFGLGSKDIKIDQIAASIILDEYLRAHAAGQA